MKTYPCVVHLRELNLISIQASWDDMRIPSRRLLHEIMADIVKHDAEFLSHGSGCACMDKYVWEIKAHINRALPEIDRFRVEEDPMDPSDDGWREDPMSRERNWSTRSRISSVLQMVVRSL